MQANKLNTAVWLFNIDLMRITWANDAALKWWEAPDIDELAKRDFSQNSSEALKQSLADYRLRFDKGETFFELWHFAPNNIDKKAYCWFSGLRDSNNQLQMLVEAMPADLFKPFIAEQSARAICTFTFEGEFESANPTYFKEFGEAGLRLNELLVKEESLHRIYDSLEKEGYIQEDFLLLCQANLVWFNVKATVSQVQKDKRNILLHLQNIDDRKKHELYLLKQSETDSLTQLFNRRGITHRLDKMVAKKQGFCLYYIDLDGFKMINDSLGHPTGDAILKEITFRLHAMDRVDGLISRYGGDEFLYVIPIQAHASNADLELFAGHLIEQLSAPYTDSQHNVLTLSSSIGFACFPEDAASTQDAIRFADAAMYYAKEAGKKRWTKYHSGMETVILRKSVLVQHLSRAIELNELSLHYQAIYNTTDNSINSFEALIRWYNPKLGHVSPFELITVAEETGLIHEIENWVLAQAIHDLAQLRKHKAPKATMAVNISGLHISHSDLVEYCLNLIAANDLKPCDLTIEVTESVLLDGVTQANNPVQRVIDAGISVSIDDFGTGYSSLAYLHAIRAKTVKIDRAFASLEKVSDETLRAIHQLITSLGFVSLLEGVETPEEAKRANQIGICLHQGYLYQRPAPLDYYLAK